MRLIFIVFKTIILLVITANFAALAKKNPSKFDKWQEKGKTRCEATLCSHLPKELNENCVNQCVAPSCFEQIYARAPLEDDEQDYKR